MASTALFRHLLVITKTISVVMDRQFLILLVSRSWSMLSVHRRFSVA